jgi:regulator of protease activity HflC (stomatin/prohibitin superfamily)
MVFIFVIVYTSCSCTQVPAGNVGVKVYLLGQKKGVDTEVLGVGNYFVGINEQVFVYPLFMRVYPFTQSLSEGDSVDEAFYFQTIEGVKCNMDIGVQARADGSKVTILFQTYRDDLNDIIHKFLRNDIRNMVNKYTAGMTIEDLYGPKKIEMMKKIELELREKLAPQGIIVDAVNMLSDIRFPVEIEASIVAKIKATQDAIARENQVQMAKADMEIKILNARGEAEALRLKQISITPTLVSYEAVMKWNGVLPSYMMGNTIPFLNLK